MDNRDAAVRREQRALKISVAAALFFALLGFGFALLTHSEAILLDGIISLVGLGVSLLTLFVARLVELPGDDTFPFGYAHFEPMLNVFKSLIMVTVCAFALVGAISSILQGGNILTAGIAIIYALIATIGPHLEAKRIGARLGFRERVRPDPLPSAQTRQVPGLLVLGPEANDRELYGP